MASRVSRTLSWLKTEGGHSLNTPEWKRASSGVEGRISWFFSSCGSKLGVSLELRRGPQVPVLGASGKSRLHVSNEELLGIFYSCRRGRGPHLELRSSLRVPLHCQHGSQDSSGVSTGKSGLVSCGDMQIRSPLEL